MSAARTVLVTGAAGFIGSHLTEALVRQGDRVRAFVRYTSTGARGWLDTVDAAILDHIEVVAGDIRDAQTVHRAVDGCDRVYHLAALIGIPYSYASPAAYVQTNVVGTGNILDAAWQRADRVERVVHTSTSECYGTALEVPITEAHPLQAQSPYAATKIAADKLAESYHRSFGLRVVILRPFNTYGPRQSTRAVIPTIITQCLTSDVVRLGNVAATRDLNFVADTVRAYLLAGNAAAADGQVINIGSGQEISIEQLFRTIASLTGRTPRLEVDSARVRPASSEVDRLLADASRARAVLNWSPQVGLEEGLSRTIAWVREHLAGFRAGSYHV
jgi:NAD dependent epimerase/dehydratase